MIIHGNHDFAPTPQRNGWMENNKNAKYSSYEKSSHGFNNKYIEMLKAGGTQDYHKLLKRFGLNPKSSNFWQMGMNLIKNLIDDLEKIS